MSKLTKKKKRIIGIGIVVLVAVVAAFFVVPKFLQQSGAQNLKETMQNRQSTIALSKMDLLQSISATGTIESAKTKAVSANVNGMEVQKVYVSVGDTVKKGDKLVAFDTEDLQDNLTEAKEDLADVTEDANDAITEAREKLAEAKTAYQKAKANKAIKAEELEKAKETYESAKKAVETAKDNKEKTVKEAQKKVEEAQEALEKCAVTAPIAGMVTAVSVEAGDNYAGGTLVQIDDTSSYTITTTIDEYDISSVTKGQRVVVLTEATGDDELEGTITFVSPVKGSTGVSTAQMGTGTTSDGYEVKISLNSSDERLRLGLTAKCSIILEEADDVFAIPYDAVHDSRDGKKVIYVSDSEDGSYTEIEVTVGMESDYYVEISGADLQEGMKVIIPTDEVSTDTTLEDASMQFPGMMNGGNMGGGDRGMNKGAGAPSMPGQ